jgi:hypothetical protein
MKSTLHRIAAVAWLAAAGSAHAFTSIPIWSENFESYTAEDPPIGLEVQTNGDWLTDPIETDSIVIDSTAVYGLPSGTFGNSLLVVGGFDPVDPTDAGVSYLIGPTAAYYNPDTNAGDLPGFRFRMDFLISPGSGTDLVDSFRLGFYDQTAESPYGYSFFSFIPAANPGDVAIVKNNTSSSIVSAVTIDVNAAYTLDIWTDMELNVAFAYIYNVGDSPETGLTLFSPSLFNAGDEDDNNLGDFAIDWISADGETWDDNYMLIDNIRIEQVPEPSAALLGLLSAAALLRRRRN